MFQVNRNASGSRLKHLTTYMQDLHLTLLIFHACLAITGQVLQVHGAEFDVMNYKAVGNGVANDTQAFWDAWAAACTATDNSSRMIVPAGKTFLVTPITFQGPCKPSVVNVEVSGSIVAPTDPREWIFPGSWLVFDSVNGLVVNGSGLIDGRGSKWWKQSCRVSKEKPGCTTLAPTAMQFLSCNDTVISSMNFENSAQTHILVSGSQRFSISNINITSPGSSPNTDGIHIRNSQHVNIQNCTIASGDDCISIGNPNYDIIINDIICGPGHGISVGSVGKGGSNASVEEIHVSNVTLRGTTNGARIKTWQGGKGYARAISFVNITLNKVKLPIAIDQYYDCYNDGGCSPQRDAVEISDGRYSHFYGTSASHVAIMLNCSQTVACTGLHLSDINLTASRRAKSKKGELRAVCVNAHGSTDGPVTPQVPCLQK